MPEVPSEIEVWCSRCGDELYRGEYGIHLTVEPCEKCLDEAKDESYEKGRAVAEEDFVVSKEE